jgi:uncharacterized protein
MVASSSHEFESIALDLSLTLEQVQAVAKLLDEGNTPAFITRFRRAASGGMNESRILDIKRRLGVQRSLAERKAIILKSIESQGSLSEDLAAAIQCAATSKQLEDLYLPYKPRKQSLGELARQRGLEPLANDIFDGSAGQGDLATRATDYVRVDRGLLSIDDVVKGIGHLIAERFADDVALRTKCREIFWKSGRIVARKIESNEPAPSPDSTNPESRPPAMEAAPTQTSDPPNLPSEMPILLAPVATAEVTGPSETAGAALESAGDASDSLGASSPETATIAAATPGPDGAEPRTGDAKKRRRKKKAPKHDPFQDYADFSEAITKLLPYRTLAINRAERAKHIRVKAKLDDAQYESLIKSMVPEEHAFAEFLEKCAQDAMQRLILPSLEREIRRELTESAEQHALKVFGRNLRHLLLKPPVRGRRVLAIDPGFRYGCHAAALDEFGKVLGHVLFQVVGNEQRRAGSRQKLIDLINSQRCQMIAIGNGSACRETEQLISSLINGELAGQGIEYVIVNEAGTNAYATSDLGREELPQCEPSVRSAVSIGRRLLDPLSELVKVDPAHLGVGLYQHDIKGKHLAHELNEVVASCVNFVGVDANTASPALLTHVSGLGSLAARRLYEYRQQHGPFRNRQQFKEVTGIGEQTFVQAAGFLRVTDGDNPLDGTPVHPESYELAAKLLARAGFSPEDLRGAPPQVVPPPAPDDDPQAASTGDAVAATPPAHAITPRAQLRDALYKLERNALATELGIDPLVVGDLIHALGQAGIDPRERMPSPVFRRGIIKIEDVQPQMQLRAQVVNVVDFGVFVDIGLGESSLIHISRLASGFVSDPHLMFAVGDTLDVWVTQVDPQRRRVTLTAVRPGSEKSPRRGRRSQFPPRRGASAAPRGETPPRDKQAVPRKPKRFEAVKRVRKPPHPVTPITQEMVEGKAPMRSFSDLAQFFTKKNEPNKES